MGNVYHMRVRRVELGSSTMNRVNDGETVRGPFKTFVTLTLEFEFNNKIKEHLKRKLLGKYKRAELKETNKTRDNPITDMIKMIHTVVMEINRIICSLQLKRWWQLLFNQWMG